MATKNGRHRNPGPPLRVEQTRTLERGAFGTAIAETLETQVAAFTASADDSRVWTQYVALSGSVAVTNGEAVLSTGTTQYAYMTLQTVDACAYSPGHGLRPMWTARFPDGEILNAFQVVGMLHGESGFGVGYPGDGSGFGFLHRYGRRFEVQALQVTTPASGSETVTVTLNGTAHAVPVTSGTAQHNAKEIAEFGSGYADSGGLVSYDLHAIDDTVYFIRQTHGDATGTYSASSTGALVGAFSEFQQGAAGTQDWVAQADWNLDPMDGGGPSGAKLDPTLGNVYALTYGWLGYLGCTLWVVEPSAQRFVPVHYIEWAGTAAATKPSVADPRYPMLYAVASLGSTTDVSIAGASCEISLEGHPRRGPGYVAINRKTAIGSAAEVPVISVMCNPLDLRKGAINRRRLLVSEIVAANVGSKDAIVRAYIGTQANLTGSVFTSGDADSPLLVDTSATAITGALELVGARDVPSGESAEGSIGESGYYLGRGQVLIITGETSASTTELVVSIAGTEDP